MWRFPQCFRWLNAEAFLHGLFCFEAYIDVNNDPRYLSPKTEHAIDLGLQSEEELDKICSFYDCKYYDIDRIMVRLYKESLEK